MPPFSCDEGHQHQAQLHQHDDNHHHNQKHYYPQFHPHHHHHYPHHPQCHSLLAKRRVASKISRAMDATSTSTTIQHLKSINIERSVQSTAHSKPTQKSFSDLNSYQLLSPLLPPQSPSPTTLPPFSPPPQPLFITTIFHRLLLWLSFLAEIAPISKFCHTSRQHNQKQRQVFPASFISYHNSFFYNLHFLLTVFLVLNILTLFFTFQLVSATPDPQKSSGKLIAGSGNGPYSGSEIKIGALFTDDDKDGPSELAFKYAVYRINKDRTLLPNRTLVYDIQYVPKDDSFRASKKACNQLSSGVSAIFGPQDPLLGEHIQSLCDALDIPHIEARLDLETDLKEFSINLYPSPAIIGRALRELIVYLNWTKIAVIYEDDVSLIKLQQLVRPPLSKQVQFIFRKGNALSFRDVLIDVRARGVYSLIIDTRPESLPKILNAILQTQMNNYKYHYHFVTFDIEVYDLENFRYNFVNLTAFRLVDTEHPSVRQILRDMEKFQPKGQPILNRTNVLRVEPALVFDSVYVFARGLQSLDRGATLTPVNVSCDNETPWADGSSLFNYINSADLRGLTGRLTFKEGSRSTVKLDLLKLRSTELEKVGEWSTAGGLNISNHAAFHDFGTTNITLRVTTILSQPYVMIRGLSTTGGLSPANYSAYTNDQLEGFCVDLLKTIAENLKFQFELYLVPDGKYGAENTTTKEWNGLVREIIDKNADLAVASMTINYARESVIHFTKPYMNLGIGILFKLPSAAPTRLFSFMSPLDVDIWLYVLAAYIMVSMTMFIVARFSPNEWRSPHPCVAALASASVANDDPSMMMNFFAQEPMENQFSMANSFWFTIVTLMHQGCDLNPKAASTRIIGAIWWFFTLILVSSYTANLAAFLTVERMITPIQSVEDLATQSKIAYGTLEAGSTMTFFRDSQLETYQKMWRFMENRPSVFVKDYDEGVRRVNEGNYAFLMESAMLDYKVQRNCNLTQIGGLLDSKGYGIATPVGSPWRDKISLEILHLQEKGVIRMLYDRWWKRPGITCSRDDKSKEGKANALGVENIGGVFVVLLGGLAVAIVVAFIEFCINSKKNAQNLRQSLCTEMSDELRIAVKCHDSKQRPALKRKCSKCVTNSKHPSSGGGGGGNLCTDPDCTAGCDMMGGDMMGGGGGGGGCGHHQCTQSQHHVLEQHPNTYVPGLADHSEAYHHRGCGGGVDGGHPSTSGGGGGGHSQIPPLPPAAHAHHHASSSHHHHGGSSAGHHHSSSIHGGGGGGGGGHHSGLRQRSCHDGGGGGGGNFDGYCSGSSSYRHHFRSNITSTSAVATGKGSSGGILNTLIRRTPGGGGRMKAGGHPLYGGGGGRSSGLVHQSSSSPPPPPPPPPPSQAQIAAAAAGSGQNNNCLCDDSCDDEGGLQEEQMLSTLVRSSTPGPGPSSSLGGQQSTGQQQQQQQQFDSDVELQRDEGMTPGNSARQITTTGSALSHYPMGTPGGGVGGGGPNRAIVDVECYTRGPTTSVIGVCRSGGGVGGYSLEPMLMTPLNGGLLDNGGGGSGGGGSGQYGMVNKGSLRNLAISQQQQQQQQIIENDTRPQYLNS